MRVRFEVGVIGETSFRRPGPDGGTHILSVDLHASRGIGLGKLFAWLSRGRDWLVGSVEYGRSGDDWIINVFRRSIEEDLFAAELSLVSQMNREDSSIRWIRSA